MQTYYDGAINDVGDALSQPGTPTEQLARAFEAQTGETMQAMLTSPHGMELMDASAATASDVKTDGEARLQAVYAAWLERISKSPEVTLPATPHVVASTICGALGAIKHGDADFTTKVAQLRVLAKMMGNGLTRK